jgi:hypothetical protein
VKSPDSFYAPLPEPIINTPIPIIDKGCLFRIWADEYSLKPVGLTEEGKPKFEANIIRGAREKMA